jgi:hypothetical protein
MLGCLLEAAAQRSRSQVTADAIPGNGIALAGSGRQHTFSTELTPYWLSREGMQTSCKPDAAPSSNRAGPGTALESPLSLGHRS